ncbi:MAG: hypothetical protein LUQ50_00910 [Methanospirillum sp.]|uniref:hypothetical protein n=1 Tax=Methanospirillum sp. TaxID=45200 RepID=UPI002371A29C|nr:hypothetical protein [Methanospirillum sp.]MDD1727612.1 hypothetical protein [Methanospirillum sp.]
MTSNTSVPATLHTTNTTISPPATNVTNKTEIITDGRTNSHITAADQQFLFLMNQYWIPDLYDIKGRMDGAATFGTDLPQMLNLSADYARIRLNKNINETNSYSLSPTVSTLRSEYQNGATRCIRIIDQVMALNRSKDGFGQDVPAKTAALSLYGTWLEYQTMRYYNLPNSSYPEIASVPSDQFMQVMGVISS